MNEFCAAMGLCNLRHIGEEIAKRRILVERYRENLSGLKGVKINDEQPDVESNYAYFPVYVNEKEYGHTRDDVYTELKKNGIIARKYFYPLTNSFACYRNQYDVEDTPVAYRISKGILTLPLYADLDVEVVDKICRILKEFGRNALYGDD
jgi:dTDP-4-amino-4,6-dideoxygalactose transaminase